MGGGTSKRKETPYAMEANNIKMVMPKSTVLKALSRESGGGSDRRNDSFRPWKSGKGPASADSWVVKSRVLNKGTLDEKYQDMGAVLGHGTQGIVRLFKNKETGEEVAVKFIRKENLVKGHENNAQVIEETIDFVNREISILMKCQGHDGLLQLYDVFETVNNVILVTEYARGGELFRRVLAKTSISEAEACNILLQMVDTLAYLHNKGIVHRDIKPENILLVDHDSDKIKIADFGLAKIIKGEKVLKLLATAQESEHEKLMKTACGTLLYAAPEVIRRTEYGPSVDIWSVGVVLFLLLSGEMPFDTVEDLLEVNFKHKFEARIWGFISDQAKDLILSLLQIDPAKRLTCEEVKVHPWMAYVKELGRVPLPESCRTLVAIQVAVEAQCDVRRRIFKSLQLDTLTTIFNSVSFFNGDEEMAMFEELDRKLEESGYDLHLEPSNKRNNEILDHVPNKSSREPGIISESLDTITKNDFLYQANIYFERQFAVSKSRRQGISISGAAMALGIDEEGDSETKGVPKSPYSHNVPSPTNRDEDRKYGLASSNRLLAQSSKTDIFVESK